MVEKKQNLEEKIDNLAIAVAKGFDELRGEFSELRRDVNFQLENHVKLVRQDYDGLAGRVKILESSRK